MKHDTHSTLTQLLPAFLLITLLSFGMAVPGPVLAREEAKAKASTSEEAEANTGSPENAEANAGSSEDQAEPKSITSEEEAYDYLNTFLTGDASELENYRYDSKMQKAIKRAGGMTGLQSSLSALGELIEMQSASAAEESGFTAYHVPCVFSKMKVDLVLYLDEEGCIAGLSTGAFTGTDESEVTETEFWITRPLSVPVAEIEGGELPGILTLPRGEGPFPVVVLVHGSGPNDRNESLGPNAPFRDIADGLARRGIAVYRYDKRTYVYNREFAANQDATLYEETIEDAVQAVLLLAGQEDIDPERIYVAGHSLGGMALPAINRELEEAPVKAAGYIFLAAPARKLSAIMREQYDYLYSLMPKLSFAQKLEKNQIYKELDRLEDLDALNPGEAILGAYPAYWRCLDEYDILGTAAGIQVPCLVLQGEEDYQVTMEDFSLWQEAFSENPNWEFHSFPGLVHLFVPGMKEDGASVYEKKQTVSEEVMEAIAGFILPH